ncbi:MAG TPA: hypothetical protein VF950_08015 [Planctomycetota bacterium]
MKTLLPAFALGLLAGLAIGRLPVSDPPPARPPAPPAAAPPEPSSAPVPNPGAPEGKPALSPEAPRAKGEPKPETKPAAPAWTDRLGSTRRVAELLSLAPPDRASHAALMRRARARLKEPDAQEAFLAELPALSREQLVVLWDVLWMGDVPQRLSTFGVGFAAEFSRALTDLYTTRTDPRDQELLCNLLLPDLGSVSDERLEHLRNLLAADGNPRLRDKARQLPVRPPR